MKVRGQVFHKQVQCRAVQLIRQLKSYLHRYLTVLEVSFLEGYQQRHSLLQSRIFGTAPQLGGILVDGESVVLASLNHNRMKYLTMETL